MNLGSIHVYAIYRIYQASHAICVLLAGPHEYVHSEVDALGVITSSRGCFERCCSNQKTPPYPHSNLSFVKLRNRRPTLLRASAYLTLSEASPRRRCGHASRFLWTRPPLPGSRSAFASSLCLRAGSAFAQAVTSVGLLLTPTHE